MTIVLAVRVLAASVALARIGRGAKRRPALRPQPEGSLSRPVTVVIPARNEEHRIGPVLRVLAGDPQVDQLIVVDDQSDDRTAAMAADSGATVVGGQPLPEGWVGKPWALQQGLEAATGHWFLTVDADVEPTRGMVMAMVAEMEANGLDHLSAGGRFVCDSPAERFLHPAFLATMVYRFGPPGAAGSPSPPERIVANGQCALTRRAALVSQGGFAPIAGHMTDDIALARHLARSGWRVAFADGTALFEVRMHSSAAEVWREWGRSLAMTDVTTPGWQAGDLAVVWLAQALPLVAVAARLVRRRRPHLLDAAMVAVRFAMTAATAPAYRRRGPPYWLSPLADTAAALRLTASVLRPPRTWRGRTYPSAPRRI